MALKIEEGEAGGDVKGMEKIWRRLKALNESKLRNGIKLSFYDFPFNGAGTLIDNSQAVSYKSSFYLSLFFIFCMIRERETLIKINKAIYQ